MGSRMELGWRVGLDWGEGCGSGVGVRDAVDLG